MTPAISVSPFPVIAFNPVLLPVQAAGFEALLSAPTGAVAELPVLPAVPGEPINSPVVVQENEVAIVAAPQADIEARILPMLAVFDGSTAPHTVSAVAQIRESDELSVPENEGDEAQPALREGTEFALPVPVPVPVVAPAPPVAHKNSAPVMERDVEVNAHSEPAPVPTIPVRQIAATPQTPNKQEIPLMLNQASAIPVADVVGLFAATPLESNSGTTPGFQTLVTDRIADAAVRPATDTSGAVAERALDVARGSLWLDQLAGDIATVQDHNRELSFRLIPAQLGQLDVKIATSESGMQLNFSTQTDEAAQIIGSAQTRLVEELKSQGVRVAGSEVNAGSGHPSFSQQNGQQVRPEIITEFERPSSNVIAPIHTSQPQNGRFA